MSTNPTRHCENCGDENPATTDGYTDCCGETVCEGADVWTADRFGTEADHVTACCWSQADAEFARQGRTAPAGSHRLAR